MTKSHRGIVVPDVAWGVCVWEVDGKYLSDGTGYLSLEGYLNDPKIEKKMAEAAKYWMEGEFAGKPVWIPGARQVSGDEYDDQMARLRDGKIPDPVDQVRQLMERKNGAR
jgi:hypothetical protein